MSKGSLNSGARTQALVRWLTAQPSGTALVVPFHQWRERWVSQRDEEGNRIFENDRQAEAWTPEELAARLARLSNSTLAKLGCGLSLPAQPNPSGKRSRA